MSAAASIPNPAEQPQSTRRDFLVLSATAFASALVSADGLRLCSIGQMAEIGRAHV